MDNREPVKNMILHIVVPCYNEEDVLPISAPLLLEKIEELVTENIVSDKSKVIFVDDGSADTTWQLLSDICEQETYGAAIKLSANCGHQNALLAGITYAAQRADAVITIDADLQDDVDCIRQMAERYLEGYEIVYGVRSSRKTDSFFKRTTAEMFYKMMNFLGAKTIYNHADYRLLGKKAIQALLQYKESNVYLRGIVPELGFKTTCVYYERNERLAGKTKYSLSKMLKLAIDGITSFSVKPVRSVLWLGIATFMLAFFFAIYIVIGFFTSKTISGWSSTVLSIWFFGSLQLMAIGIIGEYIGKTYIETKERPKFIVERIVGDEGNNQPADEQKK